MGCEGGGGLKATKSIIVLKKHFWRFTVYSSTDSNSSCPMIMDLFEMDSLMRWIVLKVQKIYDFCVFTAGIQSFCISL